MGDRYSLERVFICRGLADACLFVMEKWDKITEIQKTVWKFFISIKCKEFEISIKDLALKIFKFIDYEGEILWDKKKQMLLQKNIDSSRLIWAG